MILEHIEIVRLPSWQDKNRPLKGTVKFSGGGAEIQLPIGDEAARRILELCADGMVEAAGKAAALTRAQIFDAVATLPAPVTE